MLRWRVHACILGLYVPDVRACDITGMCFTCLDNMDKHIY